MKTQAGRSRRTIDIAGHPVVFDVRDAETEAWLAKIAEKEHEPGTTNLLIRDLAEANVFVDVGAHIGFFSLLAAKSMPRGIIHSFEIDPHNYKRLTRNLAANHLSNVRAHRVGISDREGTSAYVKGGDAFGAGNRLGRSRRRFWNSFINRVSTTTLDRYFADKPPPDVVKIDVQGAELAVLRGMTDLLSLPSLKLYVEVHPGAMRAGYGADPNDVPQLLRSHGLDIFLIPEFRAGEMPALQPFDEADIAQETMIYALK